MSLGVTKECFPPATRCHNCERKFRGRVTERTSSGEFKRCSSCHLMTYCGLDCQKEHWNAVHKRHCRFLSGNKPVANSQHNTSLCIFCVGGRRACDDEIADINSPKTVCHIVGFLDLMRFKLGTEFGFHGEGNTCGCSLEFACYLPFPFGEVSGKYIGPGLDEMLAHAFRLVQAIFFKKKSDTVVHLGSYLSELRAILWGKHLIIGESERPLAGEIFPDMVGDLEKQLGSNNAWWKALKFSLDITAYVSKLQHFNNIDTKDLDNPRLQNMKKMYQHQQPQMEYALRVSQTKTWSKFKLWPTLNRGGLELLLPAGIRCDSCEVEMKGDVAIANERAKTASHEVNHSFTTLPSLTANTGSSRNSPFLIATIGGSGGLVAICSTTKNLSCHLDYIKKHYQPIDINEFAVEWNRYLTKSRLCDVCLKNSGSSHRCSGCLAAQYCCIECQRKDQDFHKTVCADWAKDKNRRMMSSSQQKKVFKAHAEKVLRSK